MAQSKCMGFYWRILTLWQRLHQHRQQPQQRLQLPLLRLLQQLLQQPFHLRLRQHHHRQRQLNLKQRRQKDWRHKGKRGQQIHRLGLVKVGCWTRFDGFHRLSKLILSTLDCTFKMESISFWGMKEEISVGATGTIFTRSLVWLGNCLGWGWNPRTLVLPKNQRFFFTALSLKFKY